jgi:hypothetical protein
MQQEFRLDRTAFQATTAKEADEHVKYWKNRPYSERLKAAYYLIVHAYGINSDTRLDKSVFSKRKR